MRLCFKSAKDEIFRGTQARVVCKGYEVWYLSSGFHSELRRSPPKTVTDSSDVCGRWQAK